MQKDSKGSKKIAKVMHEFKHGTLHSGGSGEIVTDSAQAKAIAMSEAGLHREYANKRLKETR